jgi:hypothetical protein
VFGLSASLNLGSQLALVDAIQQGFQKSNAFHEEFVHRVAVKTVLLIVDGRSINLAVSVPSRIEVPRRQSGVGAMLAEREHFVLPTTSLFLNGTAPDEFGDGCVVAFTERDENRGRPPSLIIGRSRAACASFRSSAARAVPPREFNPTRIIDERTCSTRGLRSRT